MCSELGEVPCVSTPPINATRTSALNNNAILLLMPPRDVVQNGAPHPAGKESGSYLQNSLQRELNLVSNYKVLVLEPNEKFNHTKNIKRRDAIIQSKKSGADYCLLVTLGEFLNAAPMTFRPDHVTLASAVLINVKTKKEVWSVNSPFLLQKTNIGSHLGLIDNIAKAITKSIVNK